jgi:hypothetical protein
VSYDFKFGYETCLLTLHNDQDRSGNKAKFEWSTINDIQNSLFYVFEVPNGTAEGLLEA